MTILTGCRPTSGAWLAQATPADLARRSTVTKWTNEQLLFHMLFGYLIVRALLPVGADNPQRKAVGSSQARDPAS
jgi:hypothetical protein